ncbi:MAG: hypothetical protein QOC91_1187, partial [Solirubrobacteraceae bacterium]|nr:hypothetical protein [Solirubrobacteraceae bacterium]
KLRREGAGAGVSAGPAGRSQAEPDQKTGVSV